MCVRQACCAACSGAASKHGGQCGVWFYNGESKVCYLKTSAGPDTVTKPSPLFAAGYGTARQHSPYVQLLDAARTDRNPYKRVPVRFGAFAQT